MLFLVLGKDDTMIYTEEQITELLANPYTVRVRKNGVVFNLAFKQLIIENIDKPGMTARKIFQLAGYREELFSPSYCREIVRGVRTEAASPEGLKEPKPIKQHMPRKKHTETEFKELQDRVLRLEQQISFLKKSQHLKNCSTSRPPTNSD